MKPILTAALVAAAGMALAASTAGQAQTGSLVVRNDSGETLNCRVSREGRSSFRTILLRSGQSWSPDSHRSSDYSIYCDPPAAEIRYRLRPGTAYRLVPDGNSVRIVLRAT